MDKPKVAFYWCSSCGGCEESVVDLAEDLLAVAEAVDIVLWPVALDFKRKDIEALEDGAITAAFINGGIRTTEQREMAELLRRKSRAVIAYGACAHLGGVPGLANFSTAEEAFDRAYREMPTMDRPDGELPREKSQGPAGELELPGLLPRVYALDQVIAVEYYLPGCPPPPETCKAAVTALLEGTLPDPGTVLAPNKALCDTCPRKDSKPEDPKLTAFKRVYEVAVDPETCFLAEGVICLGPATRSGCSERCLKANMPCRGCFGPTDNVADQGGKFLSSLASIIDADEPDAVNRILDGVADPAGTFYRYSAPSSLLRRTRRGL